MPPTVVVVCGVSGCGKSLLARRIATQTSIPFIEGDEAHSADNVLKMRSGRPLTDSDRWPWLQRLAELVAQRINNDLHSAVVACSCLKRRYRAYMVQELRRRVGRDVAVVFVVLHVDSVTAPVIRGRMEARRDHYMAATMLDSQLADYEPPLPATEGGGDVSDPGVSYLRLDATHAPDLNCSAALDFINKAQ